MSLDPSAPLDKRGQFIPTRKSDLFEALVADLCPPAGKAEATQFGRMLGAIMHFEYMDELERLHSAYHYLNPGMDDVLLGPAELEAAYQTLSETLEAVLRGANFIECSAEEIARAARETGKVRYFVRSGIADFRSVRLFRRGVHHKNYVRRSLLGLRKKTIALEIYDEVLLFAAVKPATDDKRLRRRKPPLARPGSVVIKLFHDIASADLDALFPEVRVVMTTADKLMLGLPALFAGVPLLLKLAPAALVVYGLLRYYLGDISPGEVGTGEALIVASGLVALGGFLMAQWTKFDRRALRYQKEVSDLLYFHNVTNNIGIFDHLIGVAEEQECKEVLLAYFLLHAATTPMDEQALDRAIETWLKARFGLEVDFDVGDALDKLDRLGLLVREDERLSVLALSQAIVALDRRWDGFFETAAAAA